MEEEKREATIKARQSLKRKMLSDLFKTLLTEGNLNEIVNVLFPYFVSNSFAGLSYKKGLDSSSNFTVQKIMHLPFEDRAEL